MDQAASLKVISEMNVGGVLLGDGIEDDHLEFLWGSVATIGIARECLLLVTADS